MFAACQRLQYTYLTIQSHARRTNTIDRISSESVLPGMQGSKFVGMCATRSDQFTCQSHIEWVRATAGRRKTLLR